MPAAAAPAPSRAATCPPTAPAPKTVIFIEMPSPPEKSMPRESVRLPRRHQAFLAPLVLATALMPGPAAAIDLFARHLVSVEFATADGKPLADAEVRVFAPGKS